MDTEGDWDEVGWSSETAPIYSLGILSISPSMAEYIAVYPCPSVDISVFIRVLGRLFLTAEDLKPGT
jgi:hypothetical protein